MNYRTILTSLATLALSLGFAHSQELSFEKTTHDFGRFPPDAQKLTHTFTFTNTGKAPVTLKDVKSSCGCTTPEWPKEPIEPGERSSIKVDYDATTSDGYFRKSVTVLTEQSSMQSLTIEGEPRQQSRKNGSSVEGYRVEQGRLALKEGVASFGHIPTSHVDTAYLTAYNAGDKPMLIKKIRAKANLGAPGLPRTLEPKQSTKLMVTFASTSTVIASQGDLGATEGQGVFLTNDETKPYKAFRFKAEVYPEVRPKRNQKGEPEAKLAQKVLDFGSLGANNLIKTGTMLKNTGDAPLKIKGTDSEGCGCEAPVPSKDRLKPGEQTRLSVELNTSSYKGKIIRNLDIYTNDPDNPYVTLKIKGFIE